MNLRALARASDDSVYTLSLLGFSFLLLLFLSLFFYSRGGGCVFVFYLSLSLAFARASDARRATARTSTRWGDDRKNVVHEHMNSIHDYTLHPEPPLGEGAERAGGDVLYLSLFFLEIFFASRVLGGLRKSRSGGVEVVFLRRWWFNNDNHSFVWYHGAGCAWCGDYKTSSKSLWAEERATRRFCVKGRKKGRWREKRWMKANVRDDYKIFRCCLASEPKYLAVSCYLSNKECAYLFSPLVF